jgi:uncharacterized protein YqgQ
MIQHFAMQNAIQLWRSYHGSFVKNTAPAFCKFYGIFDFLPKCCAKIGLIQKSICNILYNKMLQMHFCKAYIFLWKMFSKASKNTANTIAYGTMGVKSLFLQKFIFA